MIKPGIEVTTNARRHLRLVHSINLDNARVWKCGREEDEDDEVSTAKAPQIRGLTTVVNVDEFRYRLTRWMINRHVLFSEVENSNFQDILKSVNGLINEYLVQSRNTIRNWIENDFIEAKRLIQNEVLAQALSKIHISYNLWTSPNRYAMCGVAAHFIGH